MFETTAFRRHAGYPICTLAIFTLAIVLSLGMHLTTMSVAGAALPDAKPPSDLTRDQVCALVDKATVDATFGVSASVVAVNPKYPTDACEYEWAVAPGAGPGEWFSVAVPTSTALKGKVGKAAFTKMVYEYMTSPGLKAKPLKGVGVTAKFATAPGGGGAIALAKDGRVVYVQGSTMTEDTATTTVKTALKNLPKS